MGSYVFANDKGDAVQRSADGTFIPWSVENGSPLNTESFVFQQWVEDGSPIPDQYVAPPEPLQDQISPRQFYEEAEVENIISKSEALTFMEGGPLPNIIAEPISQLSSDDQYAVKMALRGTIYSRSNPYTAIIGQLIGKDGPAMDAFWRAAAKK